MFCPYCGREGVRKAKYCSECGKKLPEMKWAQETDGLPGTGERKQTAAEPDLQQLETLLEPYPRSILTFEQEVKRRNPEKYEAIEHRRKMDTASDVWCPRCGSNMAMKEDSMLYRYRRRSTRTTNGQLIATLVFGLFEFGIIVLFGREYKCLRCGKRWRTKE